MGELTGKAIQSFKDALLAAFDHAELVQLVRTGLDANLEAIAGTGKLDAVAYHLVLWAGRNDRLGDLLAAAQAERPKNTEFAALAAELGGGAAGDAAQAQPGAQPPGLPGGISVGSISNSTISFGGTQTITQINTGGGAYVAGNVDTGGGDFVGRDKTTNTGGASGGGDKVFLKLEASVALCASPAAVSEAMALVTAMQAEAAKGSRCDDARMAELVRALVTLAPKAAGAVGAAFGEPALQGASGPITRAALKELNLT